MNKDFINTANELELLQITKGKGVDSLNKKLMAQKENEKKSINPKEIFDGINKKKINDNKFRKNKIIKIDSLTLN